MARRAVGALLVLLALVGLLATTPSASARSERLAPVGSDAFRGSEAYKGDFPDPSVLRVGAQYYAYSTTIAALNLPMTMSTDLRTWVARASADPAQPWLNDAMAGPAAWAQLTPRADGTAFGATWAPSVARVGSVFVAAYSVPRASDGRRCLSMATSSSPAGPFVDSSAGPVTCAGWGVIDPHIFRDGTRTWLLFKVEGSPDRIMVARLDSTLRGLVPGTARTLLVPKAAWEGAVVENPAMIRYRRKLYLFYSGNGYGSTKYATGYAVCRSVLGRCRRMGRLLATNSWVAGPGGAMPFFDAAGGLRLAYHAWRPGSVGYPTTDACLVTVAGCPQRRMYVATLGPARRGRLVVRSLG